MLEALSEAIHRLDIPTSGPAVAQVAQLHDALTAKLTAALAELDTSGDWALDGSVSMAAWVRTHLGATNQQATRLLRIGRRLRDLPATRSAWLDGSLTSGQIEIVVANVTDRRAALWRDHEAEVVPTLSALDITDTTHVMQRWAACADAVLDETEPAEPAGVEAHLVQTLDGRAYLQATFDAEAHEVVATALRLAEHDDPDTPRPQRRGQALLDVCRWYLDHQDVQLGRRHRPHVNVVVHHDALRTGAPGRTLTGAPLPGLVLRKLTCDANVHRVITDGASSILDYGRATRAIPPAVYTSLVLRDHHCRFPGCDRPATWTEGHHVRHWEDGGTTDLSNLVLLCSRHHHLIHTPGWHLKLEPDATVTITKPDGTTRTSHPPPIC